MFLECFKYGARGYRAGKTEKDGKWQRTKAYIMQIHVIHCMKLLFWRCWAETEWVSLARGQCTTGANDSCRGVEREEETGHGTMSIGKWANLIQFRDESRLIWQPLGHIWHFDCPRNGDSHITMCTIINTLQPGVIYFEDMNPPYV